MLKCCRYRRCRDERCIRQYLPIKMGSTLSSPWRGRIRRLLLCGAHTIRWLLYWRGFRTWPGSPDLRRSSSDISYPSVLGRSDHIGQSLIIVLEIRFVTVNLFCKLDNLINRLLTFRPSFEKPRSASGQIK